MRILAWTLVAITVLMGAVIGYSWYAAELGTGPVTAQAVPASQMTEQFSTLQHDIADQALRGVAFRHELLGSPENYAFHIYTVTVTNRGLLAADWVELNLAPGPGDILQVTPETVSVLPAFRQGEIRLTVLADRNAPLPHDLTLTYFVFGKPYSIALKAE